MPSVTGVEQENIIIIITLYLESRGAFTYLEVQVGVLSGSTCN